MPYSTLHPEINETAPCRICLGEGTYSTWNEFDGTTEQPCYKCGGSGMVRFGQFAKKHTGCKEWLFNQSISRAIKKVTGT